MSSYPISDADRPCTPRTPCSRYTLSLTPHFTVIISLPEWLYPSPQSHSNWNHLTLHWWWESQLENHGYVKDPSLCPFFLLLCLVEFNEKCLANQLCVFILLWMPEFYIGWLHHLSNSDRCAGVGCLPSIWWKWSLHSRGMKAGTGTWLFSCLG